MAIADTLSFASLNKRDKRKRNYNHEAHHDVATKTPTSPLGCRIKQPLILAIADTPTSFASLHKREKRTRNYNHETHHDAATKTPTSPLGCRIKQLLAIADAPTSFASLDKREKRTRNYNHETDHDVPTKTPTSPLGCRIKQPLAIVDAPTSFASLDKREKRTRNYNHERQNDAATKTPTSSPGCSFKQPQHESPPSRPSCTSCQTHQDDPACFKCFVASRSLFDGLQQQDSHKNGHKDDSNKISQKNSHASPFASAFASLDKCDETKRNQHHEVCDVATKTQTSLGRGIELEVQPESPPSHHSCTSCQTQGDATCFKCFVAAANLFVGLQQFRNKTGCKYDYNKTFEKEGYASFY
jgi:hypothetical protein